MIKSSLIRIVAPFLRFQGARRHELIYQSPSARCFSQGSALCNEAEEQEAPIVENKIDPAKDRRVPVPLETSIRYLASEAYKETYGQDPVWTLYRRNHKGAFPPAKTRKTCIRGGIISTGNPCPICRDEYLVLDYRNIGLLKQFISVHNGELISYKKTGLCQNKHKKLIVAVLRAKNYGLIAYDVPFRKYNYSDWYKPEEQPVSA